MINIDTVTEEMNEMFGTLPKVTSVEEDVLYCSSLLLQLKTKSSVIRYLTAEGWKRGRIAKGMNILYQHVRNEQIRQLKKTNSK